MKKKVMTIISSTILALGLVACGNSAKENTQEQSKSEQDTLVTNEQSVEKPTSKTLVVYYSATGNTKAAAEAIALQTSGDLFELVPTQGYTSEDLDWTVSDSRVSMEHDNPDQRGVELVEQTVDNWSEYDTIYIGYPIWWGIAAWPIDNFVKENDFSGKTVIPFATAASSGFGQSGELLQEMAGTGEWKEGECFRGSVSQEDIKEWLDTEK